MSNASRLIWNRGRIVPAESAMVNVLSPTSQFGLNVFEGIRCYWSEAAKELFVFRLGDHLTRLYQSAKLLGLEIPATPVQLLSAIREVVVANGYREDTAVRLTAYVDGEGSWSATGPVEMFVAPIPKRRHDVNSPPCLAACVSTWERISDRCLPPRVKAGANYINGRYGHLEARRNGYDVPIFIGHDGKVAEGAGACLLIVRKGELLSPPTTCSALESITRDTLVTLAADKGIPFRERVIDRSELYLADEIFFVGSAAEVTPITSVDRLVVADGKAGRIATLLLREYLAICSGEAGGRHRDWLTPIYSGE